MHIPYCWESHALAHYYFKECLPLVAMKSIWSCNPDYGHVIPVIDTPGEIIALFIDIDIDIGITKNISRYAKCKSMLVQLGPRREKTCLRGF